MKIKKFLCLGSAFGIVFFCFQKHVAARSPGEFYISQASPLSSELVHRQTERARFSEIENLIKVLEIKPGMTVLDIGAGSGQFTYRISEALKGTGKVYATDINPDAIKYLTGEARARNLTNIFPILVKKEGLDEFYTKNKFDLIFIAHTYNYLRDRKNYFFKLIDSLTEQGRIVILDYKILPQKFSTGDFSDFDGLIRQLTAQKSDDVFSLFLRESTRKLLSQPIREETRKILQEAIVEDFNNMLDSTHLLSSFLQDGAHLRAGIPFVQDEADYVNWALRFLKEEDNVLDESGALDPTKKKFVYTKHFFLMRSINMVLIAQKFRKYLYHGKPAPYLPGGYGDIQNNPIIQEFAFAGYAFKKKYDFIPFEIILVFEPVKGRK